MNIAIIGCGLIGEKRAKSAKSHCIRYCCDIDLSKAAKLASSYPDCQSSQDPLTVCESPEVDIVIIATPHDQLVPIGLHALKNKKHLLIEKPAGRSTQEISQLISAAEQAQTQVHVGFNHRYHRALQKAHEIYQSGAIGELMFIRGRYGHGGRLGYEKEWRAKRELSGGGELIDQGVHLIDLSRWFLGDFTQIQGHAGTYFWNMPVEDNGFLLLKTDKNQVAFLHASCTEWKNLFSFEIFGKHGKLVIEGLGGSYGTEKLTWYKMLPEMGPPETVSFEFPMNDNSWEIELEQFVDEIKKGKNSECGLKEAYAALKIVEQVYQQSRLGVPA